MENDNKENRENKNTFSYEKYLKKISWKLICIP